MNKMVRPTGTRERDEKPLMYVRIEFLDQRGCMGHENQYRESCVLPVFHHTMSEFITLLLRSGFVVPNRTDRGGKPITDYDPRRIIMPGAILAITVCDEHGYSKHDR